MSQTPNRNDSNGSNRPSNDQPEAQPLMPTSPPLETAALNDRATRTQTLRRRPRLDCLRAPEATATTSPHDNDNDLPRPELSNLSIVDDATGCLSEGNHTDTEIPSLHTSISGVTLIDAPVRWQSSETLLVPFVTVASPDSAYEARSEDSLAPGTPVSLARSRDGPVHATTCEVSYHVEEVSNVDDALQESPSLLSLEPESPDEDLQRAHSEGYLSLRHPIQLLRHIVIPRRNSRRRRVDLYPSVESTPQTNAADVSTTLHHQHFGGTLPPLALERVDQRLDNISHLDLDNGTGINTLWNVWREPPTMPSSSDNSSDDDMLPTTAPSLHSARSPALNGEDHPLRSNPPRSSAAHLLPVSPSSFGDNDHDNQEDEEGVPQLPPLDLTSPALSLPLTSTSSLESSPTQSFIFAEIPAPTSTLDDSWNAWLASRSPSQISLPESVASNSSAYFTPPHTPVLPPNYIQDQHRRFQRFYRQDISERGDAGESGEDRDATADSESMRERQRNRERFYLLGTRWRSRVGLGGDGAGDEAGASNSGNERVLFAPTLHKDEMPYLHPPELALSDCLRSCQRNRQVQKPTIDESDMKYWLTGTGSWVQTNESSAAQKIGMKLEAKDVKPSQATDLPPRHSSRSFECGEQHRWNGHGSMNEVERWTGSDADARRSAEAEVDRVRQDSKFEDMNDQEVTEAEGGGASGRAFVRADARNTGEERWKLQFAESLAK
ncbi:hypothetical protein EG327_010128 [Venturia inaequalis]|uniref:Uncharacterized protein n=1 Tax=Venturia inaequalis TaxID=5025 RepID=A0A8H3YRJ6_VENIN|nr:hypothetical protein EG327_010128 [Venturia inaequalis]